MKTKHINPLPIILIIMCLLVSPLYGAESNAKNKTTEKIAQNVQSKKEASEKRKKIMQEAVDALAETKKALQFLEENKTKEALAALETATGKMVLIVARDPDLALAPVDVNVMTHDLYATADAIKAAIKQAKDMLGEGAVQDARSLLTGLASEIVISVDNIPLATYPDAIKAITPLIDEGKLEEAKTELQKVLNTIVVTRTVIPLPIIRAEEQLKEAEKLTENKKRTDEENTKLTELLSKAREQLEIAEILGYGTKDCFKPMHEQIQEITRKTEGGKSGMGYFDKLKKSVSEVMMEYYHK